MSDEKAIDFAKLREPFPPADIEWRIAQAGQNAKGVWAKCLAYLTNRAVMDRLDAVCGAANWANQFGTAPGGGVLCGISIRINGEWVTKWDGADQTDIEAVKGGLSGAMKRAAVQWGIGRYLYDLPEGWANINERGEHYQGKNEKKGTPAFRWDPPALPEWAMPKGAGVAPPRPKQSPEEGAAEMGEAFDEADVRSLIDRIKSAATVEAVAAIEAEAARLAGADARQRVHKAAGAARAQFKRAESKPEAKATKPIGDDKQRDALLLSFDKAKTMADVKAVWDAVNKCAWSKTDLERLEDRKEMRKADFENAA